MVDKINEAKATIEDSESADAVVGTGGPVKKRLADLMKKADPVADDISDDVKTPMGPNKAGIGVNVKEAIESLFGDKDLTEDFKSNLTSIYEAAIHEKTEKLREELEAEYVIKLQEEAETLTEDLTNKLDVYLDYVVETWKTDNEVALTAGYKVEMAESFFGSLKTLMSEHNFDLDEETDQTLSVMESKVSATEVKYNKLFEKYSELKESNIALKKGNILESLAEGLVETSADRFKVLTESVVYTTDDEYKEKVTAIKTAYFTEKVIKPVVDETDFLDEETDTAPKVKTSVSMYVSELDSRK